MVTLLNCQSHMRIQEMLKKLNTEWTDNVCLVEKSKLNLQEAIAKVVLKIFIKLIFNELINIFI